MSAFIHPAGLSRSEPVAAVCEAFALAGYARYVLLLEVLAADDKPVRMSYDAWAAELSSDDESVREFMAFCDEKGLLAVEDDGECLSVFSPVLQRFDPAQAAPAPTPTDETLYTTAEQWAAWFVNDLSYPPAVANDPETLRYFARWCASRVTVGDMGAAVQRSIDQGTGLGVVALHSHLSALRAKRLQEATQCY